MTTRRGFISAAIAVAGGRSAKAFALHDRAFALREHEAFALRVDRVVKKGRLKQSVSRWPYAKIPLPDFCRAVADMGLTAVDLLEEAEWPVAREHGLVCSMGYAGGG
jgi:hypothetical protein